MKSVRASQPDERPRDRQAHHLLGVAQLLLAAPILVLGPALMSVLPPPTARAAGAVTTIAAFGDSGMDAGAQAMWAKMATTNPGVVLDVGDLSYVGQEKTYCARLNAALPASAIEILPGNHEGTDPAEGGGDGDMAAYAACLPDKMGASAVSAGRAYPNDYYFDSAQVRAILISPSIRLTDGTRSYSLGSAELTAFKSLVTEAKAQGKWVIVAHHIPYLTIGSHMHDSWLSSPDLARAEIETGVDLVLTGHDHSYLRSNQITAFTDQNTATIADADDDFEAGAGTVFSVVGNAGHEPRQLAAALGNLWRQGFAGDTIGFVSLTVTDTSFTYSEIGTDGAQLDRFVISRPAPDPQAAPPPQSRTSSASPAAGATTPSAPTANSPATSASGTASATSPAAVPPPRTTPPNAMTGLESAWATGSANPAAPAGEVTNLLSMGPDVAVTATVKVTGGAISRTVTGPLGWTISQTDSTISASGSSELRSQAETAVQKTVVPSATAHTGGDGWVPVPYGTRVFGGYHYTLDGGFQGGDPAGWYADKATGAITHFSFGLGQRFLTTWTGDPWVVDSRMFVPGYLFDTAPSLGKTYTEVPWGFACLDMATAAPCPTNWFPLGTVGSVTPTQGKRTSSVQANTIAQLTGLKFNSGVLMSAIETAGGNPVMSRIEFSSGVPTVALKVTAVNLSGMMMQNLSADGTRLYTTLTGDAKLWCTDPATGQQCSGWTNPDLGFTGSNSRITVVDVWDEVCVKNTAAGTNSCYKLATGEAADNLIGDTQTISGYRWSADRAREYYGPGYGASDTLICLTATGYCPGFGNGGTARINLNGVTDYKTYGFAADDEIPNCMWALGDAGYLYPFDGVTGAGGCSTSYAQTSVNPVASYCQPNPSITSWASLDITGVAFKSSDKLRVTATADNGTVLWSSHEFPAASTLDVSGLPYVVGATRFTVTSTADLTGAHIDVTWKGDPLVMCFVTVPAASCAESQLVADATVTYAALAETDSVSASLPLAADVTLCPPAAITIVKAINGDDANSAPGVEVTPGTNMNITYQVTNTGGFPLFDVTVTDDKVAASAITCPKTTLAIGEAMMCTASLPAPGAGVQHIDTAIVFATSAAGVSVTASDVANAHGAGATSAVVLTGDAAPIGWMVGAGLGGVALFILGIWGLRRVTVRY